MQFRLSTSGISFESVGGGIRVSADRDVVLDSAAFDELFQAVSMARTLSGSASSSSEPSVAASAPAREPAPAVVSTPAATHEGPTKRGPIQTAARAGVGGRGIPRERAPAPPTAPRPTPNRAAPVVSPNRQRGALVKHMVDWLTANPGRHTVDAIVSAAEAGKWSEAKALRPAVIAALRRTRHKIQRHPNNTFSLVETAPPRAGRIVRRQRTR